MRQIIVNQRWVLWATNPVADWGAYNRWEVERFESLHRHLTRDDILFEVGAENGWMTGVISREMCDRIVLFEPSEDAWVAIRQVWQSNHLPEPLGCWRGFASDVTEFPEGADCTMTGWPLCADASLPEPRLNSFKSLVHGRGNATPSITLDEYCRATGIYPTALNMDVEGAEGKVLRGAVGLLRDSPLRQMWISLHDDPPDHLLQRDYGESAAALIEWLSALGWEPEHITTDHESHWRFTKEHP